MTKVIDELHLMVLVIRMMGLQMVQITQKAMLGTILGMSCRIFQGLLICLEGMKSFASNLIFCLGLT